MSKAINWLRFGEAGYHIDRHGRRVVRLNSEFSLDPLCRCYDGGAVVCDMPLYEAVAWLMA